MDCVVYPFTHFFLTTLEYLPTYRNDLNICEAVVPHGLMKSIISDEISCKISNDFWTAIRRTEGLIIADFISENRLREDVIEKIILSLEMEKSVFCCMELRQEEKDYIRENTKKYELLFTEVSQMKKSVRKRRFLDLECPLIVTGGLLSCLPTDDIVMHMYDGYRSRGFRVALVAENYNLCLLGALRFPKYVFECEDPTYVIRYLNQYFISVQNETRADVIFLQLDEGFIRYSNFCVDNFGVRAFLTTQAAKPDYLVLRMPYNSWGIEEYQKISELIRYRFGVTPGSFIIAPIQMNDNDIEENEDLQYDRVKNEELKEYVACLKGDCPEEEFYASMDNFDWDAIIERSLTELSR